MPKTRSLTRLVPAVGSLLLIAAPCLAQERYDLGGENVAIYNLAGTIEVYDARGDDVVVDVVRGGADAEELSVEIGGIDGRNTLRVIFPSDRVVYDGPGRGGSSTFRVRRDGTWDGDADWLDRGERVRVSSRGGGLRAHADLRIGVPAGRTVAIYLGVGEIQARDVNGDVLLDTKSGAVEAYGMSGRLTIDTGSGAVRVEGVEGDLLVDTGSGDVRVAEVRSDDVRIDTGSGRVDARGVIARRIEIDTGSGSIDLMGSAAPEIVLDTGSGSVEAELLEDVDRLEIDTGSGSVTLALPGNAGATLEIDTGSGGIDTDFPIRVVERDRDELRGEIGDGRGHIGIDTGSGSVRLRRTRG